MGKQVATESSAERRAPADAVPTHVSAWGVDVLDKIPDVCSCQLQERGATLTCAQGFNAGIQFPADLGGIVQQAFLVQTVPVIADVRERSRASSVSLRSLPLPTSVVSIAESKASRSSVTQFDHCGKISLQ